jgi:hypothetical protein
MGNLRRKLQSLQERVYCHVHRDEPLLCAECDIMELTDDEWDELARLLEQAGFLDRGPCPSAGTCWYCGEGALACPECVRERGEPPGMALLSDADRDRLFELGSKLAPPWL